MKTKIEIKPDLSEELNLPPKFDSDFLISAQNMDLVLDEKWNSSKFSDLIDLHQQAGIKSIFSNRISDRFYPGKYKWPEDLFIPSEANAHDYWVTSAPDDHRYALDWKSPIDGPNIAEIETGKLFTYEVLRNDAPTQMRTSSASLGVYYEPKMTLGLVKFQPEVYCKSTFRTAFEYFPSISAGGVQIYAELILSCWEKIPGPHPFNLIRSKRFNVATSGKRDQSHGSELQNFENSYKGRQLSVPFVVEKGRKYLFGVSGRITVTSNLVSGDGKPLPVFNSKQLKVWATLICHIPQMNIIVKRVDIP